MYIFYVLQLPFHLSSQLHLYEKLNYNASEVKLKVNPAFSRIAVF